MKLFFAIIVTLALLSCTFDYSTSTIRYKSVSDDGRECIYGVGGVGIFSEFTAPCDCYDVGDTLNKYYRMSK